jgi:hypothetical protein
MNPDAWTAELQVDETGEDGVTAPKPVDVTVTVSRTGDVSCSPDPVVVKSSKDTIVFQMATPGWVFRATDAIVVSQPGTAFPRPSSTSHKGLRATLWDRDRQVRSYAYTVHVVQPSTGRVAATDPTIENQPD